MRMIETPAPKRRRAWTRSFASAPTHCGSRRGAPRGGPPSIGSLRRNSTFTSALTLSGNRRGGRKGELTNIWTELVNLKSLNHWKRLIRISLPAPSARCVSRRTLARLERGDRGDRRYPAQAADKKRRGAL